MWTSRGRRLICFWKIRLRSDVRNGKWRVVVLDIPCFFSGALRVWILFYPYFIPSLFLSVCLLLF